jgi:hypothetical protein
MSTSTTRPSRFHEELSYNMSNSHQNTNLSLPARLKPTCRATSFDDFVHPSNLSTMQVEDEKARRKRARERAKKLVRAWGKKE